MMPEHDFRQMAELAGLDADHHLVHAAEREHTRLLHKLGSELTDREAWLVMQLVQRAVEIEAMRRPE
jgi:hypothetical protein